MKNFLVTLGILFIYFTAAAQNRVSATISNFQNNKGVARACIFTSAESFEKMEALKCITIPVNAHGAEVVFEDLPDGNYAIFVFHDANNNGKMDRNFLGMPREGYGASLNKLPFASAPKFSDNSFSLVNRKPLRLHIRLRNM
jgi:uncharacterized protein (DUF2141 family)